MRRLVTITLWCGVAIFSAGLIGGCGSKTNIDTNFEEQVRAPKGPPPPEAIGKK